MKNIKVILSLVVLSLVVFESNAQLKETQIMESEMDQSLLMKHYVNAPNFHPEKWASFEQSGNLYYKSYCTLEGKKIVVIYDQNGNQKETWELQENIPQIVTDYLKMELGKYKAKNYRKIILNSDQEDYFAVDIDSKYRGYIKVKFYASGEPYLNGISQLAVSN
jgi:hypothetical protein